MALRHTVWHATVWLGALGCTLALSGCWFQAFEPGGHRCATQSDCLEGYQCVSSVCVPGEPADAGGDVGPTPDDAGQPTDAPIALDAPTDAPIALDAPTPMDAPGLLDDAAPLGEAGAPDASEAGIDPEAGLDGGQDAAMIEAGPEDAAMIEAGPEDAAMIEAGPEDAALDPGPG